MTESLRKVLADDEGLEITFLLEDEVASIEFRSSEFDLSDPGDVIVFINGDPVPVKSHDTTSATATIGDWSKYADGPVKLMIRVDEFFEGWEFEP